MNRKGGKHDSPNSAPFSFADLLKFSSSFTGQTRAFKLIADKNSQRRIIFSGSSRSLPNTRRLFHFNQYSLQQHWNPSGRIRKKMSSTSGSSMSASSSSSSNPPPPSSSASSVLNTQRSQSVPAPAHPTLILPPSVPTVSDNAVVMKAVNATRKRKFNKPDEERKTQSRACSKCGDVYSTKTLKKHEPTVCLGNHVQVFY